MRVLDGITGVWRDPGRPRRDNEPAITQCLRYVGASSETPVGALGLSASPRIPRGDKVKIVMRLRGRENAYPERWTTMMREYDEESLAGVARIASRPSIQGRAISMVVEPNWWLAGSAPARGYTPA